MTRNSQGGTPCFWLLGCGLALLAASACTADRADIPPPAFDEVFEQVGIIEFEEPWGESISRLDEMSLTADGRILIADQMSHKVRVYAADGALLHTIGGRGDGPGELYMPMDAAEMSDGSILVLESGNLRVSRFDPTTLEFDTLFAVHDTPGAFYMAKAEDGEFFINLYTRIPEAPTFHRYTVDGERVGALHPEHPLYSEVPYWRWHPPRIAVSSEEIFVSNDKLYPLYRYTSDGELADSFGTPPPSWVPASRPRRGEFMGYAGMQKAEVWLRSHTWVDNLALQGDTLLFVSHGRYNADEMAFRESHFNVDIYDVLNYDKIHEDIELPGRLLKSRNDLYVLLSSPPEGWTVGRYRIRAEIGAASTQSD